MSRRRILYGIHGYGRGHAARAQAVLPELTRRHDVRVLAGDDAWDQLHDRFEVIRIPTLRYYYNAKRQRSVWQTLKRGIPAMLDMFLDGAICQMIQTEIRHFQPDVVLSDSEGFTHHAAKSAGLPRISFDHYGVLAHCRLDLNPWDRFVLRSEVPVYDMLVAKPDRAVAVAFFEGEPKRPGVRIVGPILRELVRSTEPTDAGHLLVYFTNAQTHFTQKVEQALHSLDMPIRVYGPKREGTEGNITFCPIGNEPFVRDLASCRAVFSTAGNQLISEAIHFSKPLLLLPEDVLEQRINAHYVSQWGIGMRTSAADISAGRIQQFMGRVEEFRAKIAPHRRDGLAEALDALEMYIQELTG